ncbi:GNAT family N-acetyltransferase [Motiliproteus sediminis]|uniref:GNAT family N-acetyltransferase n=1 Tax=Motiliproteus sediminis TaxID=1468178 RepID=UPI001AEFD901|nr:GNAT family N-acetyltransferase [Motiliproteus sediminis]
MNNSQTIDILPIRAEHAAAVAQIIRQVGAEFGAVGEGFGPGDAEVAAMHRHYGRDDHSAYFIALLDGRVVGGGGIAPLDSSASLCELKKLFLLPEARGRGIGRALSERCLAFAREAGFRRCYLDTLASMTTAIALYRQLGFQPLDAPLGESIHGGCDVWMLKQL